MKHLFGTLLLAASHTLLSAQSFDARIHIDQFGYLPAAQKIAVIASPQSGYNAPADWSPDPVCRVKRSLDHTTVFQAPIEAWNGGAVQEQSGDKVWWFDFSALTTSGSYYLFDSLNNRVSEPFYIGECAYSEVLKQALRTFYYQRCGTAKDIPYAEAPWLDPQPCHIGAQQDLACRNIQNPAQQLDLHGGWHDAGDYNKYVTFTYGPLLDLLLAYAQHPAQWHDDNQLPESGNGIPDLLDEVKYELDWLLRMQQPDGGVLSVVGVQNFATASPPSADQAPRFYGPATAAASYSCAATFALAAMQFQNQPGYAAQLGAAARAAWNWGNSHPNASYYNAGQIAAGENQPDDYETAMRHLAASAFLFALSGEQEFQTYFDTHYTDAHLLQWSYAYPFEPHTQDALLYYAALPSATPAVRAQIRQVYAASLETGNDDNLPSFLNHSDAYRAFLRSDNYTWGSNETKSHQGNMFFLMNTYNLNSANSASYQQAGAGFLHYLHGVNPTGYCYLSNMGGHGAGHSIPSLYHSWFNDGTAWDELGVSAFGPAPGFLPGGPNPYFHPDGNCNCVISPPEQQPTQKSFKAWNTGWPENSWELSEVAIYTQAAYLRLLANVLATDPGSAGCLEQIGTTEGPGGAAALSVYPNPAGAGVFQLEHPDGEGLLQVFDSAGGKVLEQQVAGRVTSIATAGWPSGWYSLHYIDVQGRKRATARVFVASGR